MASLFSEYDGELNSNLNLFNELPTESLLNSPDSSDHHFNISLDFPFSSPRDEGEKVNLLLDGNWRYEDGSLIDYNSSPAVRNIQFEFDENGSSKEMFEESQSRIITGNDLNLVNSFFDFSEEITNSSPNNDLSETSSVPFLDEEFIYTPPPSDFNDNSYAHCDETLLYSGNYSSLASSEAVSRFHSWIRPQYRRSWVYSSYYLPPLSSFLLSKSTSTDHSNIDDYIDLSYQYCSAFIGGDLPRMLSFYSSHSQIIVGVKFIPFQVIYSGISNVALFFHLENYLFTLINFKVKNISFICEGEGWVSIMVSSEVEHIIHVNEDTNVPNTFFSVQYLLFDTKSKLILRHDMRNHMDHVLCKVLPTIKANLQSNVARISAMKQLNSTWRTFEDRYVTSLIEPSTRLVPERREAENDFSGLNDEGDDVGKEFLISPPEIMEVPNLATTESCEPISLHLNIYEKQATIIPSNHFQSGSLMATVVSSHNINEVKIMGSKPVDNSSIPTIIEQRNLLTPSMQSSFSSFSSSTSSSSLSLSSTTIQYRCKLFLLRIDCLEHVLLQKKQKKQRLRGSACLCANCREAICKEYQKRIVGFKNFSINGDRVILVHILAINHHSGDKRKRQETITFDVPVIKKRILRRVPKPHPPFEIPNVNQSSSSFSNNCSPLLLINNDPEVRLDEQGAKLNRDRSIIIPAQVYSSCSSSLSSSSTPSSLSIRIPSVTIQSKRLTLTVDDNVHESYIYVFASASDLLTVSTYWCKKYSSYHSNYWSVRFYSVSGEILLSFANDATEIDFADHNQTEILLLQKQIQYNNNQHNLSLKQIVL